MLLKSSISGGIWNIFDFYKPELILNFHSCACRHRFLNFSNIKQAAKLLKLLNFQPFQCDWGILFVLSWLIIVLTNILCKWDCNPCTNLELTNIFLDGSYDCGNDLHAPARLNCDPIQGPCKKIHSIINPLASVLLITWWNVYCFFGKVHSLLRYLSSVLCIVKNLPTIILIS